MSVIVGDRLRRGVVVMSALVLCIAVARGAEVADDVSEKTEAQHSRQR